MQVVCMLNYKGHRDESTILLELIVAFCEFQDQGNIREGLSEKVVIILLVDRKAESPGWVAEEGWSIHTNLLGFTSRCLCLKSYILR